MRTDINIIRKVLSDIFEDKFVFEGIEDYWQDNYPAIHTAWLEQSGWVTINQAYVELTHSMYTQAFNSLLAGFRIDVDTEIQGTEQLQEMVAL